MPPIFSPFLLRKKEASCGYQPTLACQVAVGLEQLLLLRLIHPSFLQPSRVSRKKIQIPPLPHKVLLPFSSPLTHVTFNVSWSTSNKTYTHCTVELPPCFWGYQISYKCSDYMSTCCFLSICTFFSIHSALLLSISSRSRRAGIFVYS